MIASLFAALVNGLRALANFLAVLFLGILVAIVWILPWAIRAASILAWIGGAYLAGERINAIYGVYSPRLPVLALWTIPAILAAALPVWLFFHGQLIRIWSAFALYGLTCFVFYSGAPWLLLHWARADLFFRSAPALFLASFLIFEAVKFKMKRSQ